MLIMFLALLVMGATVFLVGTARERGNVTLLLGMMLLAAALGFGLAMVMPFIIAEWSAR